MTDPSNYSNPAPPSGFVAPSDNVKIGLSQDDFRKLMSTPRHPSNSSAIPSASTMSTPSTHRKVPQTPRLNVKQNDPIFAKPSAPKNKKKRKPEDTPEEETTGPIYNTDGYRDRAKERRVGLNPDYSETEAMLQTLQKSSNDENSTIPEEEKLKYLGGDMHHAHLVKGLDYTLLKRQREEKQKELDDKRLQDALEKELEQEKDVVIQRPWVERVAQYATNKNKPPARNDMFQVGRLAYVFQLARDSSTDPFAIPTVVVRSKADVATFQNDFSVAANKLVLEKITTIMSAIRLGKEHRHKEKKIKKKEEVTEGLVKCDADLVVGMDDSEDIFADAGRDYVAVFQKPSEAAPFNAKNELGEPLFPEEGKEKEISHDFDMFSSSENHLVQALLKPTDSTSVENPSLPSHSIDTAVSTTSKLEGLSKPSFDPTGEYDYVVGDDDSDEDPNYSKMDEGTAKNKRKQLTRWDFENEEEWKEYKGSVEALPKAAFQFGVKMADGRKTRRTEKSKDQKLNRDYQKISKIMESKYGTKI